MRSEEIPQSQERGKALKYHQEEWGNLTGQERLAESRRILAKYGYEWKRFPLNEAPSGLDDQDTDSYTMLVGPDGHEVEASGGVYDWLYAELFRREESEANAAAMVTLAPGADRLNFHVYMLGGHLQEIEHPLYISFAPAAEDALLLEGLEALKQDGFVIEYHQADAQERRHARYCAAEAAKQAANEHLCAAKEQEHATILARAQSQMDQAWARIRLIESEA